MWGALGEAEVPGIPVLISRCEYAKHMWKYILGAILLIIGILEIVLALHGGLREALMQTSPLRLKQAESSAFLLAGISALVMGIGMLFYGLFW
jgi:hypothetical protein